MLRTPRPVQVASLLHSAAPAARRAAGTFTESEPQTSRAEKMLRRFWKAVDVERKPDGRYAVLLDKRALKTPAGAPLLIAKKSVLLAALIAEEWDNQTSITARALDGLHDASVRKAVVAHLLRYLDTDTVCFHESFPPALVKLQEEHWAPLLDWVRSKFDVEILVYEGILGTKQPEATRVKLAAVVEGYDHFRLAAFERAVLASKSYLIALALVEGHFTADQAALAAHVEVQSQIDRWGEVEDTHDVDHQDVRVRLGSAAILCSSLASQPHTT